MKLTKTLLATTALTVAAGAVAAQEMTIVSWGGAYSKSQKLAYHDPYSEKTGVTIINDDSSAEAVAKLRAMNEAGNVTWDVVDVVAADAIRLCDEGLALEIDADTQLAPAPDGTSASDDFGDLLVSDCFIPQIVYSTTFGYRTDMVGDNPPTEICAVFDTEAYPGKRSLEKRPINNMEWALICDGVAFEDVYDVLATEEGQNQALAKLDTIKGDVIWWSAGADTPQLLADGEVVMGSTYNGRLFSVIEEQKQPRRHAVGRAGVRPRWLDHSRRSERRASAARAGLHLFRNRHAASGRSGQVHLVRSGARLVGAAGGQARRSGDRHGPAHADRSGEREADVPL